MRAEESVVLVEEEEEEAPPLQRGKTLLAVLFLLSAVVVNDCAIAFIHERVPRGRIGKPLPDLWQDFFPEIPWTITVAEILLFVTIVCVLSLMFFHQHRWIVIRRVLFCAGICFFSRSVCISLFQVPVPSVHTYCAPKHNSSSFTLILTRVTGLLAGGGMDLYRGRVLCGDLILSGHTITFLTCWLTMRQYSPRKFACLSTLTGAVVLVGVVCILLARKHYSIDVLLAYYLATRVFWTYHSLLSPNALQTCPFNCVWWGRLMRYFETDAPPEHLWKNRLIWPSSCPKHFKSLRRTLDL